MKKFLLYLITSKISYDQFFLKAFLPISKLDSRMMLMNF